LFGHHIRLGWRDSFINGKNDEKVKHYVAACQSPEVELAAEKEFKDEPLWGGSNVKVILIRL